MASSAKKRKTSNGSSPGSSPGSPPRSPSPQASACCPPAPYRGYSQKRGRVPEIPENTPNDLLTNRLYIDDSNYWWRPIPYCFGPKDIVRVGEQRAVWQQKLPASCGIQCFLNLDERLFKGVRAIQSVGVTNHEERLKIARDRAPLSYCFKTRSGKDACVIMAKHLANPKVMGIVAAITDPVARSHCVLVHEVAADGRVRLTEPLSGAMIWVNRDAFESRLGAPDEHSPHHHVVVCRD